MSAKIEEVITYYETQYWMENDYPSTKTVLDKWKLTHEELKLLLPTINAALTGSRGLPPVEISPGPKKPRDELDPFFVLAVNYLTDISDKRGKSVKFTAAGITSLRFNALLRQENHKAYFDLRVQEALKGTKTSADLGLAKNVESGDLNAIKYFNELTGVYRPENSNQMALGVLLGVLMEILSKRLDPAIMVEIADEFEEAMKRPEEMKALLSTGS